MLTRIREVVEAGLTVIRGENGVGKAVGAKSAVDGSDWDTFKDADAEDAQQSGASMKAGKGAKKVRKASAPPAPATAGPGLDDADIDDAVSALLDLHESQPEGHGERFEQRRLPAQQTFTREREPLDHADV